MEWFEDDEFWLGLYPVLFPPERFVAAGEQISQLLALTQFAGRTVLDLCCGPGRHSIGLAQRGFEVTGVDRSRFLLAIARERARAANVDIEWVDEDMRSFERPGAFDLACSLFTSFGYFEDAQDDLRVLRNVHNSLVPGGVFVLELTGKEKVARTWQNVMYSKLEDGSLVFQRPEVRADWTRIRNQWVVVKDGHAKSFTFEHTIYSGRELRDLLLASGFPRVGLYGDFEGRPYGLDATRLVAVAHKA